MQVSGTCRSRLATGVFLLAARATILHAQASSSTAARVDVPCFDSIPATAFTRVAVYGTLKFSGAPSLAIRTSAELLLQDAATKLRTLLGAERSTLLPRGEPAITWRGLGAPLRVSVYRDGRITHRIPPERADTSAAYMIAKALDLAAPESAPFMWGADSLRDSVSFDIELTWPTVSRGGKPKSPTFTSAAIILFSISHPWQAEAAPHPNNRGPRYPEGARSRGYAGLVNMQVVIDTSGRPVPSSINALWPDTLPELQGEPRRQYDAFVKAVRESLVSMRFYPAEVGGCKTAQLVVIPFEFALVR